MLRYFRIWRVVLSIVVLIYTFLPYDFLPDMLLGWGWIDDILIIYLLWHYFYRGRTIQSRGTDRQRTAHAQDQYDSESHTTGGSGSRQASPKNPYDVLEIERDASKEEIKIAYKKLAGKYHPDKVVHLGEEFKVLAEKRFKEIQDAYDELKSSLGGL